MAGVTAPISMIETAGMPAMLGIIGMAGLVASVDRRRP